jgi:RHH-type proline utilization regulon transcriptional repressor/proline dehydrogenase/delta 1-pyrroline-5-carboxylate dehydrogenase
MNNVTGHSTDVELADRAVLLCEQLLWAGREQNTSRRRLQRLARIVDDAEGKSFILALTDEVLRIQRPRRAAARLRSVVARRDPPAFLGPIDRVLLMAGTALAAVVPGAVMPLVKARLRAETARVILPAEHQKYRRHAERRRRQGINLNLNVLGEAVLGEEEARRRTDAILERLSWPEVDYVSVKISSLCSGLDVLAFDFHAERTAARLRELYRAAMAHEPHKFVNLDMEEYRDLELTMSVFTTVLAEPEFRSLDAGIVLQAYLPDSFFALQRLTRWAQQRRHTGGGRIKVRLVKGANLAMEQVEAEVHGWPQAPFTSKADVDANFKRMLDWALDPEFADSVRVGMATHNLFDVAWAVVVSRELGAADRVELEMLEGMAEAHEQAVRHAADGLLLYSPVAAKDDFESTVAYMVRRLDENTGEDNFLRRLFSLVPGSEPFAIEEQRFRTAVAARHELPLRSHRKQDRRHDAGEGRAYVPFENEPDTDFSVAANRLWIGEALRQWREAPTRQVPVVVGREEVANLAVMPSVAPSDPVGPTYGWARADGATVDRAMAVAGRANGWAKTTGQDRRRLLNAVAKVMADHRGETIAALVHDAGKTVGEADSEVSEAIDFARWYGQSAAMIAALERDGLAFDPFGVVVVASPWNFPYAIAAGGVLAGLAAGNRVILKPAPETVLTGWLVARHCWEAGVPREMLQFVPCADDEAGRRLVSHPDVGAAILTGAWETARLFQSWRPDLRVHAETSGKNAIIVTEAADVDSAVRDIVQSAFGHAGQKCSAASLVIAEPGVYHSEKFRRQLRDAVTSLRVGRAHDLATVVGPLIRPPAGKLLDALTSLGPGERWLVEPVVVDGNPHLWSPGVKLGVVPGSPFHLDECFGPLLGVMRADNLDHAIVLQNASAFGLTGGLQSLDEEEVETWLARVEVGNAYVNRPITGAIVQRQPFGGWKRSVVGPGAKAGGPNYALSLGRWHDASAAVQGDGAPNSFKQWWREHFAIGHDPSALTVEENVFRYRPLGHVHVWVADPSQSAATRLALAAARVAGVTVSVSSPLVVAGLQVDRESDVDLAQRLCRLSLDKIRVIGPVSDVLRDAAAEADVMLDDAPVVSHGRIELLRWVREQSVSRTRHRYGNVVDKSW